MPDTAAKKRIFEYVEGPGTCDVCDHAIRLGVRIQEDHNLPPEIANEADYNCPECYRNMAAAAKSLGQQWPDIELLKTEGQVVLVPATTPSRRKRRK